MSSAGSGFTIDANKLLADLNSLATAGGDWQSCAATLNGAQMKSTMLGILGETAQLPASYNSALVTVVGKIGDTVKSIEASITAVEQIIHNYNGADAGSSDKIVYAGSGLTAPAGPSTSPANK
jgi:hypothetical protein